MSKLRKQGQQSNQAPADGSVQGQLLDTASVQATAQTPAGGAPLAAASNSDTWNTLGPIVTVLAGVAVILATFISFPKVKA